jgi:hypothetical protein
LTTSWASKDKSEVKIIAKYPEENIMASGWMLGENNFVVHRIVNSDLFSLKMIIKKSARDFAGALALFNDI